MLTFMQRLLQFLPRAYRPAVGGVLYALLSAAAKITGDFDRDFLAAVQQMNILTSRGLFLTFWGYMFRVRRYGTVETDSMYARRIVRTVFLPKTTAGAIVTALGPAAGATVTEYNPGTVIDRNYHTRAVYLYADQEQAFFLKLDYRGDSAPANRFFISQTFLGRANTGFVAPAVSAEGSTDMMIRDIVEEMKLAGTKVIFNKL